MIFDEHALVLAKVLHVWHRHGLVLLLTDVPLTEPNRIYSALTDDFLILRAVKGTLASFSFLFRFGFWLR